MDYITAEQFLEQSEKVRKVLKEWWKENIQPYDLYKLKSEVDKEKYPDAKQKYRFEYLKEEGI